MTSLGKWGSFAAGILYFALVASSAAPPQTGGSASLDKVERARIAFAHALPELDGRHLKATLVEVTYGPGESSMPHSHPCAVIGTMLEGALRMQVKGEPERTYKAGESFYEAPNGVHQVSANASQQGRARFLAYFVCDHEGPLSVDAPQSERAEGKQR
jgi:quercetin dioxygenase-like cupin family protein